MNKYETKILSAFKDSQSSDFLDENTLALAAQLLIQGEVVAFPTETVYGLGANALNSEAVKKIFVAKQRPAHNPLITHIFDPKDIESYARISFKKEFKKLSAKFWPGSLTLILESKKVIADEVSCHGDTLGFRIPQHPVALKLLELCKTPICAPSANKSNHVSPVTAQHVLDDLNGRIPLIIDGGTCQKGLESTVLDITAKPFRILRTGPVTQRAIEEVLGEKVLHEISQDESLEKYKSPGLLKKHYAPIKPLILISEQKSLKAYSQTYKKVGALVLHKDFAIELKNTFARPIILTMQNQPEEYSAMLYDRLRKLEREDIEAIFVEWPEILRKKMEWLAINDRLQRAAY